MVHVAYVNLYRAVGVALATPMNDSTIERVTVKLAAAMPIFPR